MKLTGILKDKDDKAETMEAKKDIIAEAGMELTDDELEGVVGGGYINYDLYERIKSCIMRQGGDITRREFLLDQLYLLDIDSASQDEDFLRDFFMELGIDIGRG